MWHCRGRWHGPGGPGWYRTPRRNPPPQGRSRSLQRSRASCHREPLLCGSRPRQAGVQRRQVGHALFISPRTVEMHVNSSMQKLQCRTRAEAVRRLTELGALPGPDVVRQEPG
jgi:hypothetical protein